MLKALALGRGKISITGLHGKPERSRVNRIAAQVEHVERETSEKSRSRPMGFFQNVAEIEAPRHGDAGGAQELEPLRALELARLIVHESGDGDPVLGCAVMKTYIIHEVLVGMLESPFRLVIGPEPASALGLRRGSPERFAQRRPVPVELELSFVPAR
jgi:hypothetical protein